MTNGLCAFESGPKTDDNFKHMSFDELRNVNETFGGFNGDLSHVSEEDEDYKVFSLSVHAMTVVVHGDHSPSPQLHVTEGGCHLEISQFTSKCSPLPCSQDRSGGPLRVVPSLEQSNGQELLPARMFSKFRSTTIGDSHHRLGAVVGRS
jgi:hypothetical protein